jgi:pterin-4a-carbinolamine dehydratase
LHVLPGREGGIVARHFRFPDYPTAWAFTNAVGALAEKTRHHPELVLGWGYCEVSLMTRKTGGLHESDFVMVARIDALAAGLLDSAWLPPLPDSDEFPEVQNARSLTFAVRLGDTCAVRHIARIWESVKRIKETRADSIRSVRRLFDSEFESREI